MISWLCRRGWLALRQHLPWWMRRFLTRRWLRIAKLYMADAEGMSPVPFPPETLPTDTTLASGRQ